MFEDRPRPFQLPEDEKRTEVESQEETKGSDEEKQPSPISMAPSTADKGEVTLPVWVAFVKPRVYSLARKGMRVIPGCSSSGVRVPSGYAVELQVPAADKVRVLQFLGVI